MDIDLEKIRELAKIVKEGELTSLKLVSGNTQIVIEKRPLEPEKIQVQAPVQTPVQPNAERTSVRESTEKKDDRKLDVITSPMVGTFYASPTPGGEAFVKTGDLVKEDSVVCVVEAMKVMNEIRAGKTGRIVEMLVSNAQPVEFGQALFRIQQD